MLIDKKEIQDWIVDVNDYNKKRRERGFENPKVKIVSILEMQKKEKEFNPILQQFIDPQKDIQATEKNEQNKKILQQKKSVNYIIKFYVIKQKNYKKHLEKYDRNYDIVNLENIANTTFKEKIIQPKQVLQQSLRDFNIVNHAPVAKYMFENVKIINQEKQALQQVRSYKQRDFNILTNKYKQDHEQKMEEQQQNTMKVLKEKFTKTHNYNFLLGKAYDEDQEQLYNSKVEQKVKKQLQKQIQQLPPSIRYRETIIFDRTKPVPEEIKLIDQQRENAKVRYKLRNAIENEYHKRNIEIHDRKQQRIKNGMFEQKYIDEHRKGFYSIKLLFQQKKDLIQSLQK
ncbi:hypothetical protein IMG5_098190, partial [Ichthyophthirius multifiliis]